MTYDITAKPPRERLEVWGSWGAYYDPGVDGDPFVRTEELVQGLRGVLKGDAAGRVRAGLFVPDLWFTPLAQKLLTIMDGTRLLRLGLQNIFAGSDRDPMPMTGAMGQVGIQALLRAIGYEGEVPILLGRDLRESYSAISAKIEAAVSRNASSAFLCVGESRDEPSTFVPNVLALQTKRCLYNSKFGEKPTIVYWPPWSVNARFEMRARQMQPSFDDQRNMDVAHIERAAQIIHDAAAEEDGTALADRMTFMVAVKSGDAPELFELPYVGGALVYPGERFPVDHFTGVVQAAVNAFKPV